MVHYQAQFFCKPPTFTATKWWSIITVTKYLNLYPAYTQEEGLYSPKKIISATKWNFY